MIRRARMSDCGSWYRLRNDPEVRFWSGSIHEIQALDHVRWFEAALASPGLLLVDEKDPGQLRGYARLEIKTVAVVSIAVHREYRNKGIGTELLWELEQHAVEMPATTLRAVVHPSNVASMRTFFKSGYVLNRNEEGFVILERPIVPYD